MPRRRKLTHVGVVAVLALAGVAIGPTGAASASPIGPFTEYADTLHLPCEAVYHPQNGKIYSGDLLAPGATGSAGSIGVLDPASGAQTHVPLPAVGAIPLGTIFGPDGNFWFTYGGAANGIGVLDPTTNAITDYPTPTLASLPSDIWQGPDNAMYFLESVAQKLGRIDISTKQITEYPLPGPVLLANTAIIMPGRGTTMTFSGAAANEMLSFDTSTHTFKTYSIPTLGALPQGSIVGPDGATWFAETGGQKIGRIDPSNGAVQDWNVATAAQPLPFPGPLVLGSDGYLWSANGGLLGGDTLGRFDIHTHKMTYFQLPTAAAGPCDIDPVAATHGLLVVGEVTGGKIAVMKETDADAIQP